MPDSGGSLSNDVARAPGGRFLRGFVAGALVVAMLAAVLRSSMIAPEAAGRPEEASPPDVTTVLDSARASLSAADIVVDMPPGDTIGEFPLDLPRPGTITVLVRGLSRGGSVRVERDGQPIDSVELFATGGLDQGHADLALVTADMPEGTTMLRVVEGPGVQVVRVHGTNRWFGTHEGAGGRPLFSVDFDQMRKNDVEYPVTVYHGGEGRPFCWFSGKFDQYYGDSFAEKIVDVSGSSGPDGAALRYTAVHAPRNLIMPMRITLEPSRAGGGFVLRVHQEVRALAKPVWGDNVEFLHLVIHPEYGRDWEDGTPDFVWYRAQRDDAPDTLPGSHTTLCRMDDNTTRRYPYPASTSDPSQIAMSGPHHTGAAVSLEGVNGIGGWFTKSGVGCIGLVFHRYEASFRDDLAPLHSHCGDGADTHFYLFWGGLFRPLGLESEGERVEIEYSLAMLPAEPLPTEIEDLNEADLWLFGKEKDQQSQIVGWLGTKDAIGLERSDGSVVLLGLGRRPVRVPIPEAAVRSAKRVFRLFDQGEPVWEKADIADGRVEVCPGWITVVDGGSARTGPPASGEDLPVNQAFSGPE